MRFEPGRIDAECYHRCPVLLFVLPARACESTTLVLRALLCSGALALFSLRIPLQQTLSLDVCKLKCDTFASMDKDTVCLRGGFGVSIQARCLSRLPPRTVAVQTEQCK